MSPENVIWLVVGVLFGWPMLGAIVFTFVDDDQRWYSWAQRSPLPNLTGTLMLFGWPVMMFFMLRERLSRKDYP